MTSGTTKGEKPPPPRLHLCGGANPPLPEHHQRLLCPRCNSADTKFCYYNNYNLSQPRHFCKSCRRYWTRGGTLRDVPVGGGCRKNAAKRRRRTDAPSPVPVNPTQIQTETVSSFVNLNEMAQERESGFDPFFNPGGFGFGSGSGFNGYCFGLDRGVGGSGSGDTWQGESFDLPDLAISSLGWGPKEY